DLNRDLRVDVVTGSGWLEQPADPRSTKWPWHPTTICPNNCSHMFVYDVDGNGLADILGSSPHGYGVWWWQQLPDALGPPVFEQHVIDDTISQTHAAQFVDLDGDRVPELVTGRRWYSHFGADPGSLEPALLVYYGMQRDADGVTWIRHEIDDESGIGAQFEVFDLSKDGKPDIVVSTKKGLIYFEQD
ncbi:MAG TPA: VCBS repeat-containing protein, partial [Kofleriaceae bacterium]